jgi:hypothetical protein
MRLRTIRKLEAKEHRSEAEQRLRDAQRAELHKQTGSSDKMAAAKKLVDYKFDFKEEVAYE